MHGDLSTINVAELLLELHLSSRTGILRLTQGEVKKGIYFKDGLIVFAHSNLNTERLGETLLRLGKITEEEFQIASVEVIEKGKRLGRALYEKGFLSIGEVNAGVSYQLQQIVYSVFNWDSGTYEFVDRERPVFEDIMVDVSTPDLLIGGIRHITNLTVLERVVGTDEMRIVEPGAGGIKMTRTNLDFGEETILRCLGERATLMRLRSLSRLRPIEFGTGMYALLISGLIRLRQANTAEQQEIAEPGVVEEMYATRPMKPRSNEQAEKPSRSPLKTYSEPDMRAMIVETDSKFHDMTDEEVLGVLPDCTQKEIEDAFRKQTTVFHPPLYSEDRFMDLKGKLKFISERLNQARERMLEKVASRLPFTGQIPSKAEEALLDDSPIMLQNPSAEIEILKAKNARPAAKAAQASEGDDSPLNVNRPDVSSPAAAEASLSLSDLETQVKKEGTNTKLLRLFAKKLREEGKIMDAEKQLLRSLEIEPQNVENHFALADLYQQQGLKIKAFRHLNIVLQIQPDNERAMELMSIKKRKKPLYEISRDSQS